MFGVAGVPGSLCAGRERLPHSELPWPAPAVAVRTRAAGSRSLGENQSALSQAIRARGRVAVRDMA